MAGRVVNASLAPGTRVAHYEVESLLGEGAMGIVYRARDLALDRPVALKVLRSEVLGDDSWVERFRRESRIAARLAHPNLGHVYYVGQEGPLQFFVMELIEGLTLQQAVERDGPCDLATAVGWLLQTARGLAAAHRAGVVHRDVKPSNVMRGPDGCIKVMDFGLARSVEADGSATATGAVLGTPAFMSPEQCRGGGASPQSDVYALGLMAWYLLAGRHPFPARNLGELLHSQMSQTLPSLGKIRPDLPPAVDRVLARLTAKDPAERTASMEEVIRLLEGLLPQPVAAAPLASRATALALDLLLTSLVAAWLVALVGLLLLDVDDPRGHLLMWAMTAAATMVALGVLAVPEVLGRRTLGKRLVSLRVLRTRGGPPRALQGLARHALRLPALVFCAPLAWHSWWVAVLGAQALVVLGGLACYFLADRRTLSDLLTRTRVVVEQRAPREPSGPRTP